MTAVVQLPHAPEPGRSQATQIEQTRAAAQVYAAVLVANDRPRSVARAVNQVKEECKQPGLAEKAFYRFNRGEGQINGNTIQLAKACARAWGNLDYGIVELHRNDAANESELLAFAWDLETNNRSSNSFIAKHTRTSRKGGVQVLDDQRDIYENNANLASRRMRSQIFNVIPEWFVEIAAEQCRATVTYGGGVPLATRVATAVEKFGAIGVSEQQLVAKLGRPTASWTEWDVAELGIVFKSIDKGEVTRDEEFPPEALIVTDDELAARPAPKPSRRGREKATAAPEAKPAEPPVPADSDEADRLQEQLEMEREIAAADAARGES